MPALLVLLAALRHCLVTAAIVLLDFGRLLTISIRSRRGLAAENLFLRKQLALFQERKVKPRKANDSTRWMMATLSRMFEWRDALWNVKPDTLIRWHRKGFRLFWRWKSKPMGRPRLPKDLRQLIRQMAVENVTWGEERIANELTLLHQSMFCWRDKRHLISTVIASADSSSPTRTGSDRLITFMQSNWEPLNSTRRHDSSS